MARPQIGEVLEANGRLQRSCSRWQEVMVPIKGHYIGYRTYANGHTNYDPEDGYVFCGEEYFEIWLIVRDGRSKPQAVKPAWVTR